MTGAAAIAGRRSRHAAGGHPWFARFYRVLAAAAERGELGRRRRGVVGQAHGRVLELGSGTGESFKHYGAGVERVIAAEPDPHMRRLGQGRVRDTVVPVLPVAAAGERLPFRDGSFDTVVAALVLCSVADPDTAAAELRRVLAPGGRLLVLEHVRATSAPLARWQDRLERPWASVAGGCRPNRDTAAILDRCGFDTTHLEGFDLRPSIPLVTPHLQGPATVS